MKKEEIINPWKNIQSLYDLQFFICPSCPYVNNSKQKFVDHAFIHHPESDQYLRNIVDGSISDIETPIHPLNSNGLEIKIEEFDYHDNKQHQQNSIVRRVDSESKSATVVLERLNVKDTFCSLCNVYFCDLKSLMKHKENIHGDVKLEDLDCATTTKLEINGGDFYNTHSNKISKINNHIVDAYVKADTYCYECDSQFCNHSTLQDHRRLLHNSSNENPWNNDQEFDFDDKEFDYNNPELYAHGDDSNYICKQCEKFCVSKKDLSFHYSSEHQELKMFHCNICAKSFGTSIRLIYHIKRHKYLIETNANEKKYKCEFCGKLFFREQQVKNRIHIVHEGRKDFKCESCGKFFSESNNLKKHIDRIHKGHSNYKCEFCEKSFYGEGELKIHTKRIHDGQKNHQCDICSKLFVTTMDLNLHIKRIHDQILI